MKLSIIGAGNMGGATAWGIINHHVINTDDLCLADPLSDSLEPFKQAGAHTTNNNLQAAEFADIVILAVKPWLVETVLDEIEPSLPGKLLISFAAGVSGALLQRICPDTAIIRVIPNIAIRYASSVSFVAPFSTSQEQTAQVTDLFARLGIVHTTDEQHLDAGMALASCGLANAMRYVRAATEGGVELGFRPDDARNIVVQTLLGAATLLKQSNLHPEAAIDQVTTAGGTTIRGLNAMEHAGFSSAVIQGLKAAAGK